MRFTKMQGLGNDYIYVEEKEKGEKDPSCLAAYLSDRHFGIGGDGVIFIGKSKAADVRMEMYNADGSRGMMCGNGVRCVAKYAYEHGWTNKRKISVETLAGIKETVILPDGCVRVNMGKPQVESYGGKMDYVSMGNPHAVVYAESLRKLEDLDLARIGPAYEKHRGEEKRVNTEFVSVLNRHAIRMRVWERGSGETLACGTGACAAAVSSILRNLTEREVLIKLIGGDLTVEWSEEDGNVYMTGPAVTVFAGEIYI